MATYEASAGGATSLGRHESLAASSAALPDGAYTTFRTYDGRRLLRLEQHLARLEQTIALEGRAGVLDRPVARAAIRSALDDTRFPESRLRVTFAPPRLFVAVEAFAPLPDALYERGCSCVTLDLHRDNPRAKDTRFIATARAAYGALPVGVEEGLLVADGDVLEGVSSNFFAIVDGVVRTEEARVLLGVTRSIVLELAESLVPVEKRAVRCDELSRVREAFISSVSREVLPVTNVDGRPVGDGRVGPLTQRIRAAFAALVAREARSL